METFNHVNCTASDVKTDLIAPLLAVPIVMYSLENKFANQPYLRRALVYTCVLLQKRPELLAGLEPSLLSRLDTVSHQYLNEFTSTSDPNWMPNDHLEVYDDPWTIDAAYVVYYVTEDKKYIRATVKLYDHSLATGENDMARMILRRYQYLYNEAGEYQPFSFKKLLVVSQENGEQQVSFNKIYIFT